MTGVASDLFPGHETLDIMVDIDDVIVPWFETVDQRCVETWAYDGSRGPCNVWSMHDFYGRTREEWEDIVIAATLDGLYTHTEPLPYAPQAVRRLRWYGHRIHIVTARGFMANGADIRRWTHEYLRDFGIGYDSLSFSKDKVDTMKELGLVFDYAIDDGVHNFENLHSAGIPTYLHDAPHNVEFETDRRVASLWEFSNIVLASTLLASDKPVPR